MENKILAWHFLRNDRRLRGSLAYNNRSLFDQELGPEVTAGQLVEIDPSKPLDLCNWGLHASVKATDALKYAPGTIISRVESSGTILNGDDKLCSTERRVLWVADATNVLQQFAFACADRAIRVHAANALGLAGLKEEAEKLINLPEIKDVQTGRAAEAAGRAAGRATGRAAGWAAEAAEAAGWAAEAAGRAAEAAEAAGRATGRAAGWAAGRAAEAAGWAAEAAGRAAGWAAGWAAEAQWQEEKLCELLLALELKL